MTEDDKQWMLQKFVSKEDVARMEARLVSEFHKGSYGYGTRPQSFKEALRVVDLEFDGGGDRITGLEGWCD